VAPVSRWLVTAHVHLVPRDVPPHAEKLLRSETAMNREGVPRKFLLVTLDPANDTPAHLRAFKESKSSRPGGTSDRPPRLSTEELADLLDIPCSPLILTSFTMAASSCSTNRHAHPKFHGFALDDEAPLFGAPVGRLNQWAWRGLATATLFSECFSRRPLSAGDQVMEQR